MTKRQLSMTLLTAALTSASAIAHAQPAPLPPADQPPGQTAPTPPMPTPPVPTPVEATAPTPTDPYSLDAHPWAGSQPAPAPATDAMGVVPLPAKPLPPLPPLPKFDMPEVLTAPTGHILPAAMMYWRSALDTGGGFSSDGRIGLGDVAEFGIATTDLVRAKQTVDATAERIQPYVTATFRMGVGEDRLFDNQPALALGFEKSFERHTDDHTTQVAQLHLVASKHFGSRTQIHVGGMFWDASLADADGNNAIQFHQGSLADQIRPFGGIEVRPLDNAIILVDLSWSPEFCYGCATQQIQLRPVLSWGVRYVVADWLHLESGVRVQDIGNADLLDAQIFGQVTFLSGALRRVVDAVK